jgi:hypothetical protein
MNKEKLRVVLDKNIILASAPEWSRYRLVMGRLIENYFETYLATEILLKYEEKLVLFYGREVATFFLDFLLLLPVAYKKGAYFSTCAFFLLRHFKNTSICL